MYGLGPEWVGLVKNVNQARGSEVLALGLDRGGEWSQVTTLSIQGHGLHSNYQPILIPGFLYSLRLGHPEISGYLGIKSHRSRLSGAAQ